MSDATYHLHQRLSLKSQACTVRYIGEVQNKTGTWLGVEWDDPSRGKHDGRYDGVRYFDCRSKSSTSASFLRPSQQWDRPRSFLQALTDKYFKIEEAQSDEILYVSRSKRIEEVGFEKFALRQAELKGIHVLVLDNMQINSALPVDDHKAITQICAGITDLDLSGNLFEKLDDILDVCSLLPQLRRLTFDSNRFEVPQASKKALDNVRFVGMSNTFHTANEIAECLASFSLVEELVVASNALTTWQAAMLPAALQTVNLSHNEIRHLDDIAPLFALPQLRQLSLKDNKISSVEGDVSRVRKDALSSTLQDLDLGRNAISSWTLIDALSTTFPALQSLRVSGNPLFSSLRSADGKPLAAEDGYMLAIARLPTVRVLNYSSIRDTDRLNAEKYYLNQIALELGITDVNQTSAVIAQHPRWKVLCQEYGEPDIDRGYSTKIDPNSLAARLVTISFTLETDNGSRQWTMEVPRACNVYALYGLAGRELNVMPVRLKLIWETGEQDPVSQKNDYQGPEWWDSSDEEESHMSEQWVTRSVDLVSGTRPIGTYFEGQHASVRVVLLAS